MASAHWLLTCAVINSASVYIIRCRIFFVSRRVERLFFAFESNCWFKTMLVYQVTFWLDLNIKFILLNLIVESRSLKMLNRWRGQDCRFFSPVTNNMLSINRLVQVNWFWRLKYSDLALTSGVENCLLLVHFLWRFRECIVVSDFWSSIGLFVTFVQRF